MANEYDIAAAFQAIEDELISSMMRNMSRHQAEETKEGIRWTQWQAEQLKSLEVYKRQNRKKFSKKFGSLNNQIESLLREAYKRGGMEQEIQILKAIQRGYKPSFIPPRIRELMEGSKGKSLKEIVDMLLKKNVQSEYSGEFFRLNQRKLEALIKATTNDMKKAETAVLRMANDQYRKAVFNAQVYANTGAGTYKKAVDMAAKDMLSAGLNCVQYSNGARHTLSDYADMAIRTASKRAYLQGEGVKRQEWGLSLVIMNKRGNPCPKCLPFVNKVLIDDVWSGGSQKDGQYPLMSKAIERGLYHPRCKDSHTTYFPGISTADGSWSKEELDAIEQTNKTDARRQYAKHQVEKFERLAKHSLDKANKNKYLKKSEEWAYQFDSFADSDIIKAGWSNKNVVVRNHDEKEISRYKTEHAILYDSSGNKLFMKSGKEHSVEFTYEEMSKMAGGVLTHNHPRGATFSEADIYMLYSSGLSEIRVVARDGVYVMRRPRMWPAEINTLEKLKEIYRDIDESFKQEMENLFISQGLSVEDYNIIYQDKIVRKISDKYGLDYSLEEWK